MAFNLADVLKNVSDSGTGVEQIEYIPLTELDEDPDNFYHLSDIPELADNIALCGLQQPIRVRQKEDGRYIIVSGHRRRAALEMLVADGYDRFSKAACIVERDEVSPALQQLRLIYANAATRKNARWRPPMGNLDKDLAEMRRLGYSSYGKYKLDHPNTGKPVPEPFSKKPKQCAPPKIHQLTCAHCGKAFTSKTSYKKYCSDSCYRNASQQHYRARIAGTRVKTIGICQICGASFQQLRSTQKYCGKECNTEAKHRNQREWRARLKEAKQCSMITK